MYKALVAVWSLVGGKKVYEALVAVWTVAGDNKIYKALVVICGVAIGMHVILFAFMFAFLVYMFIVLLCGGPNW